MTEKKEESKEAGEVKVQGVSTLRIEQINKGRQPRLRMQDFRVFVNGVEVKQWRNLQFTVGVDNGVARCQIDFFPDTVEIDADVLAQLIVGANPSGEQTG